MGAAIRRRSRALPGGRLTDKKTGKEASATPAPPNLRAVTLL
jgi:hypothetical protein